MTGNEHIKDGSLDEFGTLVVSAKAGNGDAEKNLFFVSLQILKSFCRHKKLESGWIALNGEQTSLEKVLPLIVKRYTYNNEVSGGTTFPAFREFLIDEWMKVIGKGFDGFTNLLKEDNQGAWKMVFNDLEKKAALWFYKKTHTLKDDFRSLYCESIELMHRNLSQKQLHFNDSSEFKSYFFRVLENKYYEYSRDSYTRRSRSIEEAGKSVFPVQEPSYPEEEDESRLLLSKALHRLSPDERHILTEYYYSERKLNEIAEEMKISEGNIRIKKYRALQKMSDYLTRVGYGSRRG